MYLPWPGLFDLIKNADLFIHYDDVQLPQGRSFCSRVQIKVKDRIFWLSVPLIKKTRGLIKEAIIDNSRKWQKDHINKIKESLYLAPFYQDVINILESIFEDPISELAELNIILVERISKYLGITTQFKKASQFHLNSHSTQRLVELCEFNKATHYITGHGARNYLDYEMFEEKNIEVQYIDYNIAPYNQYGTFTPYVSILDLIAHKGKESIMHLQSNIINWRNFIHG